ncbi:Papln [Scenedesmus sp. PABB004]|nr:Papln [Scenedesmus sp. PABB004]
MPGLALAGLAPPGVRPPTWRRGLCTGRPALSRRSRLAVKAFQAAEAPAAAAAPTAAAPAKPAPPVLTPRQSALLAGLGGPLLKITAHYHVEFGDYLKVVGSSPELGAWMSAGAPTMVWGPGDVWHLTVPLGAGEHSFKVVVQKANGAVLWEGGENRVVVVPETAGPGDMLVADCAFNFADIMPTPEVQPVSLDVVESLEAAMVAAEEAAAAAASAVASKEAVSAAAAAVAKALFTMDGEAVEAGLRPPTSVMAATVASEEEEEAAPAAPLAAAAEAAAPAAAAPAPTAAAPAAAAASAEAPAAAAALAAEAEMQAQLEAISTQAAPGGLPAVHARLAADKPVARGFIAPPAAGAGAGAGARAGAAPAGGAAGETSASVVAAFMRNVAATPPTAVPVPGAAAAASLAAPAAAAAAAPAAAPAPAPAAPAPVAPAPAAPAPAAPGLGPRAPGRGRAGPRAGRSGPAPPAAPAAPAAAPAAPATPEGGSPRASRPPSPAEGRSSNLVAAVAAASAAMDWVEGVRSNGVVAAAREAEEAARAKGERLAAAQRAAYAAAAEAERLERLKTQAASGAAGSMLGAPSSAGATMFASRLGGPGHGGPGHGGGAGMAGSGMALAMPAPPDVVSGAQDQVFAMNSAVMSAASAAGLSPPPVSAPGGGAGAPAAALAADGDAADGGAAGAADSEGWGAGVQVLAAIAGCAAVGTVMWSEFVLKESGCGLPPGPYGLVGAAEGLSYLAVLGFAGAGLSARAGSGGRAGLPGALAVPETLAYGALAAGLFVLASQLQQYGYIPPPLPGGQCYGDAAVALPGGDALAAQLGAQLTALQALLSQLRSAAADGVDSLALAEQLSALQAQADAFSAYVGASAADVDAGLRAGFASLQDSLARATDAVRAYAELQLGALDIPGKLSSVLDTMRRQEAVLAAELPRQLDELRALAAQSAAVVSEAALAASSAAHLPELLAGLDRSMAVLHDVLEARIGALDVMLTSLHDSCASAAAQLAAASAAAAAAGSAEVAAALGDLQALLGGAMAQVQEQVWAGYQSLALADHLSETLVSVRLSAAELAAAGGAEVDKLHLQEQLTQLEAIAGASVDALAASTGSALAQLELEARLGEIEAAAASAAASVSAGLSEQAARQLPALQAQLGDLQDSLAAGAASAQAGLARSAPQLEALLEQLQASMAATAAAVSEVAAAGADATAARLAATGANLAELSDSVGAYAATAAAAGAGAAADAGSNLAQLSDSVGAYAADAGSNLSELSDSVGAYAATAATAAAAGADAAAAALGAAADAGGPDLRAAETYVAGAIDLRDASDAIKEIWANRPHSLWGDLPEPLVLRVLSFLPPALRAWAAKLVCKAARERFRGATAVSLRCPELPLEAVQAAWRAVRDGAKWQQLRLARARAACGDVAGLAWLRGAGCVMGRVFDRDREINVDGVCWTAASHGQLAVLEWARDQGLDLEGVCRGAASGGHMTVLRWARTQSPPLPWTDDLVCCDAAARGDLEMLRWLRTQAQPAPWSVWTCQYVGARGHLEVLRWLRANGCLWRRDACERTAALKGHEAMVALPGGTMSAAPASKRLAGPTTRAQAAAAAAAGEALAGAEAAPSLWRDLPEPLVLHVLSFLPPALQAWAAKLVCKAARERFRSAKRVSLRCPDLPLAAAQEAWPAVQGDGRQQSRLARARAACGDVAGLAWLRGAGCDLRGVCWQAAEHGQLAVLEWARGEGLELWSVCTGAAVGGHLGVLHWARAQTPPLPWGNVVCFWAAQRGDVEMLRWARAQAEPAPWDREAVRWQLSAAPAGKRHAGPTTGARAAAAAAAAGEAPGGADAAPSSLWGDLPEPLVLHVLSFLPPALQAWAAKLVCKTARERFRGATVVSLRCPELPLAAVREAWRPVRGGDPWQQLQLARARAACGDVPGLAWLCGAGCDMHSGVCYEAAKHGHVPVLEWARDQGLDLRDVCHDAAYGGQLGVLRWARAQTPPVPWDGMECWHAAERGDLEMLRWARAQAEPAPWNSEVCCVAAENGHLEALRWLRANGCPWQRMQCEDGAFVLGHEAVVAWIRAQPVSPDDGPGPPLARGGGGGGGGGAALLQQLRPSRRLTAARQRRAQQQGAAAAAAHWPWRAAGGGQRRRRALQQDAPASGAALPFDIAGGVGNATAATRNPWYDSHVLAAAGGAGGGLLYGRLDGGGGGGAAPRSAGDGGAAAADAGAGGAAPDPPPYEYPPVGRHPTVFFTAALQGYSQATGLGAAEQARAAFSAAVNDFLAPAPGAAVSATAVLTQALSGSGLWLPAATALLGGDAALLDYLAATLAGDPNLVFPTATWGSVRCTNIRVAAPATPAALAYAWSVGDYGNCSALCGGGRQARRVACLDSLGNDAQPSACAPPAPPASRACQTQPCQASLPTEFSLALGGWGACNSSCGAGSRTRSATCISREGYVGSLANCATTPEALAAQLWEPCLLPPCASHFWSYGDWACNNTAGCGGGAASRAATCVAAATGRPANATSCDVNDLDSSTKPCAMSPCAVFYWRTRELADCLPEEASRPCGRVWRAARPRRRGPALTACGAPLPDWAAAALGPPAAAAAQYVQRRRFDCVNMTSGEVVPYIWCSGPKPELGDVECTSPANCTAAAPPVQQAADGGGADGADGGGAAPQAPAAAPPAPADGAGGQPGGGQTPAPPPPSAPSEGPQQPASSGDGSEDLSAGVASVASVEGADDAGAPATPSPAPSPSPSPPVNSAWGINGSAPAPAGGDGGDGDQPAPVPLLPGASAPLAGVNETTPPPGAAGPDDVAPPTAVPGNASGTGDAHQLGPGQLLPDWLLARPTAALQALLDCPAGMALSADGRCCAGAPPRAGGRARRPAPSAREGGLPRRARARTPRRATPLNPDAPAAAAGAALDFKGACCDAGAVDACGVCNGTGRAIDALGACCSGTLDAQGVCCGGAIDECGVCDGANSCDAKADALGSLPSAALFLIPNSNANRRLRGAIQDAVAAALAQASGRPADRGRVGVVLSAYAPPGGDAGAPAQAGADGGVAVVASQFGGGASGGAGDGGGAFPQQLDVAAPPQPAAPAAAAGGAALGGGGAAPDGAPPLAQPGGTFISSTSTLAPPAAQPVQLDTVRGDDSTALNVAVRQAPNAAPGGVPGSAWYLAERAGRRLAGRVAGGLRRLAAAAAAPPPVPSTLAAPTNGTAAAAAAPAGAGGAAAAAPGGPAPVAPASPAPASPTPAPAASPAPATPVAAQLSGDATPATSSNTVVVGVTLHSAPGQPGPNTGLVLLALSRLLGEPLPVPGSRSKLTLREVVSVVRAGTCGDGVCQVNERVSWNNPDSCPADCALPFLSCPPFNASGAACAGRGVCFNSIGACSCATGYTGADCSMCALDYKLVNSFCVAAAALAPRSACAGASCAGGTAVLTVTKSLAELGAQRSLAGGAAAVACVTLGSLAAVAGAALLVRRARHRHLLREYEAQVQSKAAECQA